MRQNSKTLLQRLLAIALLISGLSGCNSAWRDNNEPLTPVSTTSNIVMDPDSVQFVNDLTRPWGLTTQSVQGVSLITGLKGTGSDPGPTAERAMLLSEMQTRGVERPSEVLTSPETSIAMVRGKIPPGLAKETASIWKFEFPPAARPAASTAVGSCRLG